MIETQKRKTFDLEDRTFEFAESVRALIKELPKTMANLEDGKQLIRSSGSVGANYIEANEALSKKDFLMRIKICRKESKESRYWLRLIEIDNSHDLDSRKQQLITEASELMNIFGSILVKCK